MSGLCGLWVGGVACHWIGGNRLYLQFQPHFMTIRVYSKFRRPNFICQAVRQPGPAPPNQPRQTTHPQPTNRRPQAVNFLAQIGIFCGTCQSFCLLISFTSVWISSLRFACVRNSISVFYQVEPGAAGLNPHIHAVKWD